MKSQDVRDILKKELEKGEKFSNLHGITRQNLKHFLVKPFKVYVDPDDLETEARKMWIVLTERKNPKEGYVIVYDPLERNWGVAEHHKDGKYILVVESETFEDALDDM